MFIDIVGYSKLLINEQSNRIRKLKEIVRGTEQVRPAEGKANCYARLDFTQRQAINTGRPDKSMGQIK